MGISKNKISSSPMVTLVASTSDWAQQGEDNEEYEIESSDDEFWEETGEDESDYELPEEPRLFVRNLPYDMDALKLAGLFDRSGIVESVEVIYNEETNRGYGFVTMRSFEEAEKAIEMFNHYDINGRVLNVNKAPHRESRAERTPRAIESSLTYVGNLPWQVDDARLQQVFSEHGKVMDAKVIYDQDTGRSRGFGTVRVG